MKKYILSLILSLILSIFNLSYAEKNDVLIKEIQGLIKQEDKLISQYENALIKLDDKYKFGLFNEIELYVGEATAGLAILSAGIEFLVNKDSFFVLSDYFTKYTIKKIGKTTKRFRVPRFWVVLTSISAGLLAHVYQSFDLEIVREIENIRRNLSNLYKDRKRHDSLLKNFKKQNKLN